MDCISWSYVCDGKWDCPRGDDELVSIMCNNNTVCKNMYHCRLTGQMCLHLSNMCDGHKDCPFGDDESFYELKTVYCPTVCLCLMYAIDCRGKVDENIEDIHLEIFLSIYFANFKLNSAIILKLKYATTVNLPQNEISDICDTLRKATDWKFILLDLSHNSLTSIEDKCFSATRMLRSLAINNNNIISLGKYSFLNLSHLNFLSLRNNPISDLHHNHLLYTCSLKLLNIINVSFQDIKSDLLDGSKVNFVMTKDYHICCMVSSGTVCTAFQPWYISCYDILPMISMKTFFISISVLIIILNLLSITLQTTHTSLYKAFSLIVICINANDILCGIYISFIWIADISFSGSFHVKEELWRSGFLCFTAFTTVLWFTVLTELVLIFMSLARLMVTISPLHTRFKETLFVAKSLGFLISCSLLFTVCISIIFKSMDGTLTTSLCLPFVDPGGSQLIIKCITWFTVVTQLTTSITIAIMHFCLITEVKKSEKNIEKSKSKHGTNKSLLIQLITITVSNIICWFPAGCIYIYAMFLSIYPIDLIICTTVSGLPINSIINPFIFIVTTVRKIKEDKLKPKVLLTGNAHYKN